MRRPFWGGKRPRLQRLPLGSVVGLMLGTAAGIGNAHAAPFQDLPVFESQNGTLSMLLVAARRPAVPLGPISSDLWTYEACLLPAPDATSCPTGTGQAGLGGVRLQLQPGDTLRVRLVNKLPPVPDADHIADNPALINNPTNLHTHGLIVDPHRALSASDPYGDYVFLQINNPANNAVPPAVAAATPPHPGLDMVSGVASYEYKIDANHPKGLFWFHPHLHGLAVNQVSAGMAGIITLGSVADACANATCVSAIQQSPVRHLVLKDAQVKAGGLLMSQIDPGFCDGSPAAPRLGTCAGTGDFAGGSWMHTVNGQVYPEISVDGAGEIWRILNAGASRSYELSVVGTRNRQPLTLQILAIDGVTIGLKHGTPKAAIQAALGGKAKLIPCPGTLAAEGEAVCTDALRIMPSARVDVRVVRPNNGANAIDAVLRTAQYDTGDGDLGDHWPAIDLAAVSLASRKASAPDQIALADGATAALSPAGILSAPTPAPRTAALVGPAVQSGLALSGPGTITPDILTGQTADRKCQPLAPGHRRKILFGFPSDTTFGLGYVEVDANGHEIEATRIPILPFDPSTPMVCVPLPGGKNVAEVWELVNLTSEDHNFHIHQTRFLLLAGGSTPGNTIPATINGAVVLHDNVPLPRPAPASNAAACDGTLAAVQSGACRPTSTFVLIPFRELGDFVFHCHILEHEDGGMMARIRVVRTP